MTAVRTIRLYGQMGSRFGRVHKFALESNTVAEAVQALCSQIAGFKQYLLQAKDHGIAFHVFLGKRNIGEKDLQSPTGSDDIRIAPVIMGYKSGGVGQFIAGAVLFVVGAVISYFSYGTLASIGGSMMYSGVAMMIGGVVQMLTPMPKGAGGRDSAKNQPSYVFNGAVNTEA